MPARLLARLALHLRDLLVAQVAGWLASLRRRASTAWAARPGGARAGATLILVALAVGGLAAVDAQRAREARRPSPLDWRAAGTLLARDARPGDAVLLAPPWLEQARSVVPASVPVLTLPRLAGERLPGLRRIWLLTAPGTPWTGWEVEVALARRAARADAQVLGGLEVTRFDLREPVLPVAVLAERAPDLAQTREAGGQPRACLVLRPHPGEALVRALPATPLGTLLAGHVTLLPAPGEAAPAPVRIALQVDGEEVGAVEVGPADGRVAFELDTAQQAFGLHEVTLVATTAGDAPAEACLEALALP